MRTYPAIVVQHADADLLAAFVDDFAPTAIEPRESDVRVFFTSAVDRDKALAALTPSFAVTSVAVSDEDWARRSQENLQPVRVGRITLWPNPESLVPQRDGIVIRPSMGFGTGHHATTRLCLEALQTVDLVGKTVLDAGTGSGVLAMAAALLGASRAIGIDADADAIQSARENLELNSSLSVRVTFAEADLTTASLPDADIVTANLTGALLVQIAARLQGALRAGGVLILSGVLAEERDDVCRAFRGLPTIWEREEDGWAGFAVKKT